MAPALADALHRPCHRVAPPAHARALREVGADEEAGRERLGAVGDGLEPLGERAEHLLGDTDSEPGEVVPVDTDPLRQLLRLERGADDVHRPPEVGVDVVGSHAAKPVAGRRSGCPGSVSVSAPEREMQADREPRFRTARGHSVLGCSSKR